MLHFLWFFMPFIVHECWFLSAFYSIFNINRFQKTPDLFTFSSPSDLNEISITLLIPQKELFKNQNPLDYSESFV